MHYINHAAYFVLTIHAHSCIILDIYQQPVLDQAHNPPDPHSFFSLSFGKGVLQYPAQKWLLFLD